MIDMKKFLSVIALMLVLCLTGCNTTMSMTYNVSTGDQIKVTLDTTDSDYKLATSDGAIKIKSGDTVIATGSFMTADDIVSTREGFKSLGIEEENGVIQYEEDGHTYVMYNINGNTGVYLDTSDADIISRLTLEMNK